MRAWWGCCLVWLIAGAQTAVGADEIRFKDGKEISGTILGKNGQRVVIQVPREEVVSVNGQPLPAPVTTGSRAPAFTAVDLTGATHTLQDARGRVVLLKFWATWCPHCRSDVPLMKDLFTRYHDQGLQILTVSVDQDVGKLKSFAETERLPYPVIAAYDPATPKHTDIPDLYETQGIPAYFLIDQEGRVLQTFSGSFTEGRFDLEGLLKPLLSAKKDTL